MGTGPAPPASFPGIFIEMLQLLDKRFDDLQVAFHRAPWQRCLNNIKQQRSDVVVASYRPEREVFGMYPNAAGLKNELYAISTSQYCLFTSRSSELGWNGQQFSSVPESPLAVPQGYSIIPFLENHQMPIVKTNSTIAAMELLSKDLAVGAVTYCEAGANFLWDNANKKLDIKAQSPPLSPRHGYLMFSQKFFNEHRSLAKRIWQEMAMIRDAEFRKLLDKYEDRKLD